MGDMTKEDIARFYERFKQEYILKGLQGRDGLYNCAERHVCSAVLEGDRALKKVSEALLHVMDKKGLKDDDLKDKEFARAKGAFDAALDRRRPCRHMKYHSLLPDRDIEALSNGAVREEEAIIDVDGSFNERGLFDPWIFGGASPHMLPERDWSADEILSGYGTNFGHIELPRYVLAPQCIEDAAMLLHCRKEDIRRVALGQAFMITEPGGKRANGQVLTDIEYMALTDEGKEHMTGTWPDAIRAALINLGLPDHPERMCFKTLPVVPPCCRPVFYDKKTGKPRGLGPLNLFYQNVLHYSKAIKAIDDGKAEDWEADDLRRDLQMTLDREMSPGGMLFMGENTPGTAFFSDAVRTTDDPEEKEVYQKLYIVGMHEFGGCFYICPAVMEWKDDSLLPRVSHKAEPLPGYPETLLLDTGEKMMTTGYSEAMKKNRAMILEAEEEEEDKEMIKTARRDMEEIRKAAYGTRDKKPLAVSISPDGFLRLEKTA